jgi:hypothetical protein
MKFYIPCLIKSTIYNRGKQNCKLQEWKTANILLVSSTLCIVISVVLGHILFGICRAAAAAQNTGGGAVGGGGSNFGGHGGNFGGERPCGNFGGDGLAELSPTPRSLDWWLEGSPFVYTKQIQVKSSLNCLEFDLSP